MAAHPFFFESCQIEDDPISPPPLGDRADALQGHHRRVELRCRHPMLARAALRVVEAEVRLAIRRAQEINLYAARLDVNDIKVPKEQLPKCDPETKRLNHDRVSGGENCGTAFAALRCGIGNTHNCR